MGVGDGARAARTKKCCGRQRVRYAPASPKTAHLGVVPQGLHDSKVLLVVVCAGRSLMRPGWPRWCG